MKHRVGMNEYTDQVTRKTAQTTMLRPSWKIHRPFGTRAHARVCIQIIMRRILGQRPTYSYDDSPDPSLPRQQQQKTMDVTRRPTRKAPPNVRPATSHDMKMVPEGVCVNGKGDRIDFMTVEVQRRAISASKYSDISEERGTY
jgi:hypothetical protein